VLSQHAKLFSQKNFHLHELQSYGWLKTQEQPFVYLKMDVRKPNPGTPITVVSFRQLNQSTLVYGSNTTSAKLQWKHFLLIIHKVKKGSFKVSYEIQENLFSWSKQKNLFIKVLIKS
jgi:hypothetical protein